jgi:hypothetical protein
VFDPSVTRCRPPLRIPSHACCKETKLIYGLVRAMQRNGSLHQVSEASIQRNPVLFCNEELQKIRIYCQRNRVTRELLRNPSLPCDCNAKKPLSLLPVLFQVLKTARRMLPNSMFVGLLQVSCSGNSIGPQGHNKRRGLSSCGDW